MLSDVRGLTVTAANSDAVAALDATVDAYCGMRLDTGEYLKRALAADPNFLFARTLKGYFMMLFARRDFVARAAKALAAAEAAAGAVGGTPRERSHLAALRSWVRGDWRQALARWEAILIEHPRDLVALRLVMGVGESAFYPCAVSLLANRVEDRHRAREWRSNADCRTRGPSMDRRPR